MRNFYLFLINDNLYSLFKDNPYSIYNILKEICSLNNNDSMYGNNLFKSICSKIDADKLNRKIFIDYHRELCYKKDHKKHIYNNLYLNEETYMEIKNSYIKIKSNKDYSYFLRALSKYNLNLFVCDFKNHDYFFLENSKMIV